jgi:hypothetical protein
MEAEQAFRKGERATVAKMLFKPLRKFVWRYFFKLGFLDGVPGLFFCVIKPFGIYLKYALLWELQDGGWAGPTPMQPAPPVTESLTEEDEDEEEDES